MAGDASDPGGIGRGLAADLVSVEAMDAGAEGVWVSLGGDVRVAGTGPTGAGWSVAIQHPLLADPIAKLDLSDCAVATTRKSGGEIELSAVVADAAWAAAVLAKAVLLRGTPCHFDILQGIGAEGLIVDKAGRVDTTIGFRPLLEEPVAEFVG